MPGLKKVPRVAGPQTDVLRFKLTSAGTSNPTISADPSQEVASAVYSATGIWTITLKEKDARDLHVHLTVGGNQGITAQPVVTGTNTTAGTITITWYTGTTTAAAAAAGTTLNVTVFKRIGT